MCRFYGWTPDVIDDLSIDRFHVYARSMHKLKGIESLNMLRVMDFPHLKEKGRDKIFNDFKDQAFPEKKKILTMDELARKLNRE